MNELYWISEEVVKALGWTILHSVWQGALIVLLLAILMPRLKKASLRYFLSILGLISLLGACIFTFSAEFHHFQQQTQYAAILAFESASEHSAFTGGNMESEGILSMIGDRVEVLKKSLESYIPLIVSLWILGASIFSIRLAGGYIYLFKLSKTDVNPIPDEWLNRFEQLKVQMGIRGKVKWIASHSIGEPITIFHFKPLILFPVSLLSGLAPEQVEAIILHELAHIRRADFLINIIQTIIEIVLFYHPASWWISGRIRQERESCCDDHVMACGMDPFSYAEALTHVQSFNHKTKPMLSMSALGKGGSFTARIQRLFGHYPKQSSKGKSLFAACLLALCLTFFAFNQPNQGHTDMAGFQQEEVADQSLQHNPIDTEQTNLMLQSEDRDLKIVITNETSAAEIKELQRRLGKQDIKLTFSNLERNAKGKIIRISGSIEFPDGVSGGFTGKGRDNMQISIVRPQKDGEWKGLSVNVSNNPFAKKEKNQFIPEDNSSTIILKSPGDPENPLFILDGKVLGRDIDLNKFIDPKDIATINVSKDQSAIDQYGSDASDGVVEIISKNKSASADKEEGSSNEFTFENKESENDFVFENDKSENEFVFEDKEESSSKAEGQENPLYILDGLVIEKDELKELMPEDIESINVFKGESAVEKYGEKGTDGVVEITTKNKASQQEPGKGQLSVDARVNVFPNSFKDVLNIEFFLEEEERVKISLQDISGKKVADISSRKFSQGNNSLEWDGSHLSSGTYLILIKYGKELITKRVVKE